MALEGTIKDFGLADIFQLIGLQKKTGTLFLKGLEATVNIHFEDGAVVKAEESVKIPKYSIGRILINRDKIKPYQLEEALEVQKTTARKIGGILIGQELINKDDLRDALSFQMKETVYRVFRWKGGDYKFYQDKVEYDRDTVVPLSSEHLLMDGVRMLDEWPKLEKVLPPSDIVLERDELKTVPEEDEAAGEGDIFSYEGPGGLSKEALQTLKLVRGGKTVYEIIESSPLGEFDASKAIVELLRKGYLRKTESLPEIILHEKKIRHPMAVSEWLVYVLYVIIAAALSLVFLQLTGTRRIMDPRVTKFPELKTSFCTVQVEQVRDNVNLYYFDNGSYPKKLSALKKPDYGSDLTDPWGRMLEMKFNNGEVIVESAGPDGYIGTDDDISSNP
jgi:Domain of unknown function (DUF4388)/Type II secretion system (T2SS), protein G